MYGLWKCRCSQYKGTPQIGQVSYIIIKSNVFMQKQVKRQESRFNDRRIDTELDSVPELDSEPKRNSRHSHLIKFTLLPIIPLILLAYLSNDPNSWTIDGRDHFYFEMISVTLSFIVAYFCIMRGYAFKDKFSLFIGLGFHVGGMVDVLHGVFAVLNFGDAIFESYFIPQTWVAGRIVMGIVLMIAVIKYKNWHDQKITGSMLKLVIPYTIGLAALSIVVVTLSLTQPFPFVIIDFPIQRPYEMIGAMLFFTALIFFYKNRLHKNTDNFFKGIMVAILIDIFVNVIISYSSFVFDTAFNVAHTLKNVSLFIFVMALGSSITQQYKIKNSLTGKLTNAYSELKEKFRTEKELADLKQIAKAKQEFLSMITHELKTPLTPIIGYADALKMEQVMGPLSEKQLKSVNKITKNAKKLKRLISDIFDAQKLDLGQMKFDHEQLRVDELITDVIEDTKFIVEDKKIQIVPSVKEGITIKSDKNRISQVLNNLINNAIEFVSNETGVIRLSAEEVDKSVVFSVVDNGKGIPKDLQKNLFQKFYQADSSETRSHGGSGLGLTICKGIVEHLGGKIWLESEVGKGSKFFIRIPKDRKEVKD